MVEKGSGSFDDRFPAAGLADGAAAQQAPVEITDRASGGRNVGALVVVAAGVVALVAGLSLLGRAADDDTTAPDPDGTLPTLPGFFTTTSTVPTTLTVPTTVAPTTMVPGEFLLGEPTGLWLFYGGADPLQRLDLDSGELIQYGIEAFPVISTGNSLIMYQAESQVTGWVSAADPGQQALNWKPGPVAPGGAPGQLWVLDVRTDLEQPSGVPAGYGRWELFDTTTNRILDRRPADLYEVVEAQYAEVRSVGGRPEALRPGPNLSSRPDGVYRFTGSDYAKLSDGRLLIDDGFRALVVACAGDDRGDCRYTWIDTVTGEPLELPVPEGPVVFAELLAGGSWLHTVDRTSRSRLYDLSTGERLEYGPDAEPMISPDGRWLAVLSDDLVSLFDLTADRRPVFEFRGFQRREGGDLLMVARTGG